MTGRRPGDATRGRPTRARLVCTVALASGAALLAACGGAEPSPPAPKGSAANPLVALPNPTPTRTPPEAEPEAPAARPAKAPSIAAAQRAAQRAAERRRARAPHRAARRGPRRLMPVATPVSARRPCTLVAKSRARALLGAPILEPLEAPQGPTCIYRTRSGSRFVTLAVQAGDVRSMRHGLRDAQRVAVGGRSGVCGRLGRPILYVTLAPRRALSVAAPCELARRFAAEAVRRLRPGRVT